MANHTLVEGSFQYVPQGLMVDYQCTVRPKIRRKKHSEEIRDLIRKTAMEMALQFNYDPKSAIDEKRIINFSGTTFELAYHMWP